LDDNLVERVSQIIPRYSMLEPGDRVGVAVSGGADSVVLLHILKRLIGTLAVHLTVLHVNHGLRGPESDGDERFVRELAGTLGLEFVGTRAEPGPGNLEQEARRARREFFRKCREQHGLQKVALGHTRSDQAETVLYRFLRGSGMAGLAGMRPVSTEGFIRPLLTTSRAEVRAWALAEGLEWREDSSNADEGFVRNRLRSTVLPALACEFNPNLEGILAGMADVAATEEDYWQAAIEALYRAARLRDKLGLIFQIRDLTCHHRAVQRRLIRRAICELRGDLRSIDLRHVDAVQALCESEHSHQRAVIPGVDAIQSFGFLLLTKPGELSGEPRNYSVEVGFDQRLELPFGAGTIELSVFNSDHENCVNFNKESQFPRKEIADLDFEALANLGSATRLEVRNWRPGDEILRPGHHNPEKIKSLFQEFQILLWKRRHWPIAVVNGEVFWARGFGAGYRYSAKAETRTVARLCYWPGDEFREL
jgi:tRNA(Ile)-lysidine synthase